MATKNTKITPLGDRVLIQNSLKTSEKKTKSGIIIPETVKEDRGAKEGKVIAVGEGKYIDGKLVPLSVKVGQSVLFSWGDDIVIDGEEYHLVSEGNILGVVN
ncbi:co-chaperone GroES [Candidatus Campbellbacteria bacterium CG22_combo_CG10-13_8_21_14_all_36_13]|uniref:Co-chaperonin GroES n=1 Tax=Candidatus Campbellbacteria bacterium CG22_combo_CG10-13_8_21_14_all_36_13 TaxID=1974529 RepID=A0A2H0DYY4_9BACT|nr:MAG: co-chaperone GroES [Candidatus Campbellbacteria bacterium CG22_combo_CG10-13_8_21_14_all_36_13]